MKMIITIIMTLSTSMIMMKHPLSMGFSIIMLTMLTAIMMNMMIKYSWYSYILVLVMLGGMLVLFMYMASIASNEIMKFSMKILLLMMAMFIMSNLLINFEMETMTSPNMYFIENQNNMSMMKLFNSKTSIITILLATYLLITMIYVIFITNMFEGPMRKKN
uniref:NADH dehydrogenase subunit 6 n=1 Tax=Potamometra berezowskii TaxID=2853721 RepID=UPI001EDE6078|nr:NADH dehydrogenase subunit 6 [Potamometra berezowskii]UJY97001.1 NADH dehydrogenase subunit 6 [Potamometra berezowskii]UJY97014.1 NADH dehydrogenase subunit 6 [Potamometra berezowskii]UJY97040.1 NADH dehydrogenase subunit 6 [Potamometra berezowskii]UJY97053.1 NADH dehydrogenase subunit 6 [Potamometra berezowskii]UJY97066.1 NADH dehydrogenase subunit 6 [Potamometra berezowskii]